MLANLVQSYAWTCPLSAIRPKMVCILGPGDETQRDPELFPFKTVQLFWDKLLRRAKQESCALPKMKEDGYGSPAFLLRGWHLR